MALVSFFSYKSRKGTEYVIGSLPLGGYVRLLDEREQTVPEDIAHLSFNRQKIWKRFIVIFAGPFANKYFYFV